MENSANKSVDKLYGSIRNRYNDARANGYRFHTYFLREQEIIISALTKGEPGVILDIGCGSGLMAIPLKDKAKLLIGLDFNEEACKSAKLNSLDTIRGNAFSLPLKSNSINNAYCCQFLNQQPQKNMELLLMECYRVLVDGGKLIIIWRNGKAVIHRSAHIFFKFYDLLSGQPSFPVVDHSISEIECFAHSIGFVTSKKQTIFPLLRWHTDKTDSMMSKLIGASCFLVLERPKLSNN